MAKILVVDDEQNIRTILSESLKREEHEVFEASSGQQACEILDANTIELAAAVTFDVRASYTLTENLDCWVTVENIFDADVETSRAADGLTSLAPGRFIRAGMGAHW